jgi:hypothetical protein
MPLPPQYRLLIAIILLLFLHPLSAQRWEDPQVLPDAPAFMRALSVQSPRLQGQDVRILQERLLSLGYDDLGAADGYFGPRTDEAFGRFASFNGVRYDGVVDSKAWHALFSADRKENETLPGLGNRHLVYAFGMWGLINQEVPESTVEHDLDPSVRVPGYLHFPSGEVKAVTARVQWYWEAGPYAPNDFSPTVVFNVEEKSEPIVYDSRAVFSPTRINPFYSSERLQTVPQELLSPIQILFAKRAIDAPIEMASGYKVYQDKNSPVYFLYLSHTNSDGVPQDTHAYNILVSAHKDQGAWVVTYIEGRDIDTELDEDDVYRFAGFGYRFDNFADIDGNGFPDVSLYYAGGAWGNGEKLLLLGSGGGAVRTIFGFGD